MADPIWEVADPRLQAGMDALDVRDYDRAEIFFRQAADAGHPEGYLMLSNLYYIQGDDIRSKESFFEAKRMADQNDAQACFVLSLAYDMLQGSESDDEQGVLAKQYLQKAVDLGNLETKIVYQNKKIV
jgi:TPR repeat protein